MTEVNNIFLVGNKFIPKLHLKQPRINYSTSEKFTINKDRMQKPKKTGD